MKYSSSEKTFSIVLVVIFVACSYIIMDGMMNASKDNNTDIQSELVDINNDLLK